VTVSTKFCRNFIWQRLYLSVNNTRF